uniref:Protein TsetseEP domain-containing protein n=1 Tax=Stomoxys calcitrans TaxID=35570 RepID=A0A1I8P0T9_STOCA
MGYIKVLAFLALVALAKGQKNAVSHYYGEHNTSVIRNDDYVDAHRRQYAGNIWFYDFQINQFKEAYLERVNSLEYQKDALLYELVRVDEHLYPITLLSDFSKSCVQKYQPLIPQMSWAKSEVDRCISAASAQANNLISAMSSTNRTLQSHYATAFEREINTCKNKFNVTTSNYTMCVANAVAISNTYTLNNQNQFSNQMQAAKNSADVLVKTEQECTFGIYNTTLSRISEANTRIDGCLNGMDDCTNCKGHYCEETYLWPASHINPNNATMNNPWYGRNVTTGCLMLNIF